MKATFRKFIKLFFGLLTLFCSITYAIACLVPYTPISLQNFTGFFAIAFPYLLIAQLLITLFWLMTKPKYALLTSIVFLFGIGQIKVFFAFNKPTEFVDKKQTNSLRIATWNIRSFNGFSGGKTNRQQVVKSIYDKVKSMDIDILCFQEFNTQFAAGALSNTATFSTLFPYSFFSKDYRNKKSNVYSGCIIFSKYPITDSFKQKFPIAESVIGVAIKLDTNIINVYTTHLQSFKFKKEDYDEIERIENSESILPSSTFLVGKMKTSFKLRASQAITVLDLMSKSEHPNILCGDFNDIPNSSTYHRLAKNRQDAFLTKGFGIGRTYQGLSLPTLRIDYLLPDQHFTVLQTDNNDEGLSDHSLLITDLLLQQ